MSNNRYVSMHISSWYRASVMDRCCLLTLIFDLGIFGFASAAGNQYGTVSVVGPAFVNREVTLKMIPFFPWGCDVEWRCIREGSRTFQTMSGTKVQRYSEDGSFFFKWIASIEYENADFYAVCSTNTSIGTSMVSLNMKDIAGQCGALVLLSPVVRGANVELGYFPADHYIQRQNNNTRTWKKNFKVIQLRNGSYEEDKVSEYFYKLTVFNFDETDKGTYTLECNLGGPTESVHVYIQERPSHPILGPMTPDFNTTECIYVYAGSDLYCKTDNGTEPVQVVLLLGNDSFLLAESKGNKGLYRFHNVHKLMAGLSKQNVTCLVSYAALESPYEVHGILCDVGLSMETYIVKESNPKILNLTCRTGGTCIPCLISWSSNSVFLYPISTSKWTKNSSSGYISVSNALYFITKDVDGKRIHCSAICGNDSSDSEQETYTIRFQANQETTTNNAFVVTLQLHTSVLYALSGTLLLVLVTTLTVLLFRRCKHHAYEKFLHQRRHSESDPSRHVYDEVQSTVETTTLHDL